MKKYLILVFALIITILSCEKDDICIEDTTPQLVIRFYDNEDVSLLKELTKTYVWVEASDTIKTYNELSLDSLVIPLDLSKNSTSYIIENNAVLDTIEFSYDRNDIFVSRSCGYKTLFENLEISSTTLNWIKNTEIINSTIENDTVAHIHMYH